jgi:hypothetical protein
MSRSDSVVPGRVFISYRRDDSAYPAGWLFDRLVGHVGRDRVFKDVDSIQLGEDFAEKIITTVESSSVLLAIIGIRWLEIRGKDGQRRLDNPQDLVRLEVEAALKSQVRVIPVLVDGAQMPRPAELPRSLQRLAHLQAMQLSPDRFGTDTSRLLAVLDESLATRAASATRMDSLIRKIMRDARQDTQSRASAPQSRENPNAATSMRPVAERTPAAKHRSPPISAGSSRLMSGLADSRVIPPILSAKATWWRVLTGGAAMLVVTFGALAYYTTTTNTTPKVIITVTVILSILGLLCVVLSIYGALRLSRIRHSVEQSG